jgi:hypothetical protein
VSDPVDVVMAQAPSLESLAIPESRLVTLDTKRGSTRTITLDRHYRCPRMFRERDLEKGWL